MLRGNGGVELWYVKTEARARTRIREGCASLFFFFCISLSMADRSNRLAGDRSISNHGQTALCSTRATHRALICSGGK